MFEVLLEVAINDEAVACQEWRELLRRLCVHYLVDWTVHDVRFIQALSSSPANGGHSCARSVHQSIR